MMLLHMGKAFCTAKYTVLSACGVLVHVLLLCNYTLDIARYLWMDEGFYFFFPSSLVCLAVNKILTLCNIHICALN